MTEHIFTSSEGLQFTITEQGMYLSAASLNQNRDAIKNALASAFILPILVAVLFFVIAPIVGNTVQEWQTRPAKKNA